jgi:glycosyltransferase involved in cell wall biosynthesis
MHVAQISFFVDPARRRPEQLLESWHSLVDIAASVASAGARVSVIQANVVEGRVSRGGVDFHFIAPEMQGEPLTRSSGFARVLGEIDADVFHVHGLGFPREVSALGELAPRTPILLQDHADRLPRFWRRGSWQRGLAQASAVSFCARAQAEPFVRARLLGPGVQIFEIPESTSAFSPGDQDAARAATGMHGAPAVLWVGHLDRNKDPLTVLAGISAVVDQLPDMQMWCCFGTAPLLAEVRSFVDGDPRLRGRVHLLGRVPHERIELLMRAADLFVLGSHREGSSFSLIEALATGLFPVVTDIPSLRALTGAGAVGALWRCDEPGSLATALLQAAGRIGLAERLRTRAHFDACLAPAAIGGRFIAAYSSLLDGRNDARA